MDPGIGRHAEDSAFHTHYSQLLNGNAEILVPLLFDLLFQLQHGGRLHGTSPSPSIGLSLAPPMASLHSILPGRTRITHNVWPQTKAAARALFEGVIRQPRDSATSQGCFLPLLG